MVKVPLQVKVKFRHQKLKFDNYDNDRFNSCK